MLLNAPNCLKGSCIAKRLASILFETIYKFKTCVHRCSAGKSKYACVLSSLFYLFLNIIMAPGAIYGRAVYGNANCCLLALRESETRARESLRNVF